MKPVEQFGVQPHSQGALYPAIIGKVERYSDKGEFQFASWSLTLDGRTEEYATYDDAETVARALLAHPDLRADWRHSQRYTAAPTPVKSAQSPAYGQGFNAYKAPQA